MSRLTAYMRSRLGVRHHPASDWGGGQETATGPRPPAGGMHGGKHAYGTVGHICKGTQILLMERYRELRRGGGPLPAFADVEFRNYSQNGEDGILLYILSLIGMTTRKCVEICAGDGVECNSANLILNHGYNALLVDGDDRNIAIANEFYSRHRETFGFVPKAVKHWIERETIDRFLHDQGMAGEIDVLTVDIDGNDYWIWNAIECSSPRVVVVEYDNAWGPDDSVTMRYESDFVWRISEPGMPHGGASLAAFVGLGRRKGYRLVGSQMRCFNAFFVRDDIGRDCLPEVSVESCLTHDMATWRRELRLSRPESPLLERFVQV